MFYALSARFPRWLFSGYETMKDLVVARPYKRPNLNAYGISMGYVREAGLKVGYTTPTYSPILPTIPGPPKIKKTDWQGVKGRPKSLLNKNLIIDALITQPRVDETV